MTGERAELQIDEDLDFQRRAWRFQRLGWAGLGSFLLAAVLGLLGSGPLSSATARSSDGRLTVHHPRFARQMAPAVLDAQVAAEAVVEGRIRLWLDREYLAAVEVHAITPEPERVEAGPDRLTYTFVAAAGGPLTIRFSIEPRTVFRIRGRMGLHEAATAEFATFVYP